MEHDAFEFWLERPSGFPLLIVKRLREDASAYMAGMRNGDIVVRVNGQPVWELTIGEVLLMFLGNDNITQLCKSNGFLQPILRSLRVPFVLSVKGQHRARKARSQLPTLPFRQLT